MRKTTGFIAILFLATLLLLVNSASAQREGDNNFAPPPDNQNMRGNLMRRLGLTKEQIQQIRKLNAARGPLMQEAQSTLREANRSLDEAIYADTVDEKLVDERLREFNAAQAEVARIRALSEIEIRKVLSPEQLVQFRQLREQFRERREEKNDERRTMRRRDGPPNDAGPPLRRQPNRQRP